MKRLQRIHYFCLSNISGNLHKNMFWEQMADTLPGEILQIYFGGMRSRPLSNTGVYFTRMKRETRLKSLP